MSRPSVRSAARQLVKRTTVEQKRASLELLLKQWGALYVEQVARKADVLLTMSAVDVRSTAGADDDRRAV